MTNSFSWLKTLIIIAIILLLGLAIILWLNTPYLFDYFNMAFCPH